MAGGSGAASAPLLYGYLDSRPTRGEHEMPIEYRYFKALTSVSPRNVDPAQPAAALWYSFRTAVSSSRQAVSHLSVIAILDPHQLASV